MNPSVVHCADRSLAGDISFHLTLQPLVFLRLLTWGMSCPLCIRLTQRSGDAVSPIAKAKKTTGASVKLFKEVSPSRERLPSAPCRRSSLPFYGVGPKHYFPLFSTIH